MSAFLTITGVKELDDALSYLRDKSAKRIGKAASRRMAAVLAQFIRKQVPSRLHVQGTGKGIGSRGDKAKMSNIQMAKAGVAVGKAGREGFTIANKGNVSTQQYTVNKKLRRFLRAKMAGVGISARNLHWFALGTKPRYTGQRKSGNRTIITGRARHYTGIIDKQKFGGFIQRGVTAGKSTAVAEAAKVVNKMIKAEWKAAKGEGAPIQVEFNDD